MELLRFAEFLNFDKSLNFLANRLALNETWDYSDSEKEFRHGNIAAQYYLPILGNYLEDQKTGNYLTLCASTLPLMYPIRNPTVMQTAIRAK